MRLIVADDDQLVLDGLAARLRAAGHDVVAAVADGPTVLLVLERTGAAGHRVDAVILDTVMPGGGPELVRAVCARPEAPAVVAISGSSPPSTRRALLAAGAAAFVHKGVDDVVSTLERLASA